MAASDFDERFADYVFQRDTMWSLLLTAIERNPDYYDETIFKLCVFDNVEFCWTHQRVCDVVYYRIGDGSTVQTYICPVCGAESRWNTWTAYGRQESGLHGNPYGEKYKRRVRTVVKSPV